MTMIRKIGKKTGDAGDTDNMICPSCGAPLDTNQSGECPYCGSLVTNKYHNWILTQIEES